MGTKIFIGQYLFVRIQEKLDRRKTERWGVYSVREESLLGTASWFGRWRQYTFNPEPNTTFNSGCLGDLAGFLRQINEDHRKKIKKT